MFVNLAYHDMIGSLSVYMNYMSQYRCITL